MTKLAMSKPVGKILDSKIGKRMVKVGDAVIKGAKFMTPNMKNLVDDAFGSPEKEKAQREAGKKLNEEYSGRPTSFKYGIQKRKIA